MAKYRYEFYRRSLTCETYFVEADSEEAAREILMNGGGEDPILDFVDWHDEDYILEDSECIDPLYKMVKDYETPQS